MNTFTIAVIITSCLLLISNPTKADERRGHMRGGHHMMHNALSEGGRLYDKWWQEYGLKKPTSTHPAYPASGAKKGADTWRCKECHGWDYRGNKGAYSKGSHFTGIKGIQSYSGESKRSIVNILKDNDHQFDKVMLNSALHLVAKFVSKGQTDSAKFINNKTKKAKGDKTTGQHVFADKCVRCHGINGKDINFGDSDNPEYVGTVASKNPWEALHKIYNGHPGSEMNHKIMHSNSAILKRHRLGLISPRESMPAMRFKLSEDGIKHLLSYMQTLPTK